MTKHNKNTLIQVRCTEDTHKRWKHVVADFKSSEDAMLFLITAYNTKLKDSVIGRVI